MSLSIAYRDVRLKYAANKPEGSDHGLDSIPGMYALSCIEAYTFGAAFNTGEVRRSRFELSGAHDKRVALRCDCGSERRENEHRCTRCGSTKPGERR
jgi:hypothetical protein